MPDYQPLKSLIQNYYHDLSTATPETVEATLARYHSDTTQWYGVYPFHEQHGCAAIADAFWKPFLQSWGSVQRRLDIFLAGTSEIDGTDWVISMGHFMGLLDRPWLGLPPPRKLTCLRYAEFHQITSGRITRASFFCDLIGVMHQLGLSPLPPQTGASLVYPGPRTHDGLLLAPQDPEESTQTLALVNRMIADLSALNQSGNDFPPPEYLARTWHSDMVWYGPAGIGATYTIERYQEQHQYPFRSGLQGKTFNGHLCRLAEGNYAGFFGWPNLTNQPCGGFLGLPASSIAADMRVVDLYRREGDKLAENWVFIDLLWWLKQQGVDLLERTTRLQAPAFSS